MASIVITGGSGFIGTRLCKRLEAAGRGFQIVDKAPSTTFPGACMQVDVRQLDRLRSAVPEGSIIMHLAAEHRDDVRPQSLYEEVNVGGAVNVCQVAREKNIRKIIFTSSVAVYGFAPIGVDENGAMSPFNEYGRTKMEAEKVLKAWQSESPEERTLVIVRPTVVFGERNRGNVYNLLRQISSGRFLMIGEGRNRKSLAYVENVAAFLERSMELSGGVHVFNYADKPDFEMTTLVATVRRSLGAPGISRFRVPYALGISLAKVIDGIAWVTGRTFPISAIRVRKFCANTVYGSSGSLEGFVPPVPLEEAIQRTVKYEFLENHQGESLFFSE